MKTISLNVSEPIYAAIKDEARRRDRKTAELIREAMEDYLRARIGTHTSLRDDPPPVSVGGLKREWSVSRADLLGDFFEQ